MAQKEQEGHLWLLIVYIRIPTHYSAQMLVRTHKNPFMNHAHDSLMQLSIFRRAMGACSYNSVV